MCLGDLRTGSSWKNPNSAAGWREAEEWAGRLSHQLRRSCRHAFIVATKTKDQRATHASRALCEKAKWLARAFVQRPVQRWPFPLWRLRSGRFHLSFGPHT